MMISFVITFCNQNKYIERAINSIYDHASKSDDFEIIIGLDRPDSETFQILSKYEGRNNFKVYTLNSDLHYIPLTRAAMNRSFLLRKAKGDYAMMLDGDDCYTDFPHEAAKFLDANKDYSGYVYEYACFDEKNAKVLPRKSFHLPKKGHASR